MKIDKCYGVIEKKTGDFLEISYKYPIPFYATYQQAKNALRAYKGMCTFNEAEYEIVEIDVTKGLKNT